jgi:biotin carboxyl carrier protein
MKQAKNSANSTVFILAAMKVPANVPTRTPGVIRRTMSQRTAPWA